MEATSESKNESKLSFERKPVQDIRFRRSKSGKYILVDVVQTWIFPSKYFEALANNSKNTNETSSNT